MTYRILIIEDTQSLALTYQEYLVGEGYEVIFAATGKEAAQQLKKNPDLVFLDLNLPDVKGMDILKGILPTTKVVVITSDGSLNTAIEATRHGAYDFLVKPFPREKMVLTARNALEHAQANQKLETYQQEFDRKEYSGFIGSSLVMQTVYRMIDAAAPSKATVFITGESGTGKDVCARAIHEKSPRSDRSFVVLNCGAIPRELIESEIFGHVKGAFTGATSDREGAAARADGGTLFLDEICEMDLESQVKLLRFLQTGAFMPVGADKEQQIDVRIICATNKNPLQEVKEGRFREDLYYRLHVISIDMPPLHQREADVLELAQYFLRTFAEQEGKHLKNFSNTATNAIANYHWPGNVRQLLNVIQTIVVMNNGEVVEDHMLPEILSQVSRENHVHPLRRQSDFILKETEKDTALPPPTMDQIRPLWEAEKHAIETAIRLCNGNIPQAAARLGINPSTIYRKKKSWDALGQVG